MARSTQIHTVGKPKAHGQFTGVQRQTFLVDLRLRPEDEVLRRDAVFQPIGTLGTFDEGIECWSEEMLEYGQESRIALTDRQRGQVLPFLPRAGDEQRDRPVDRVLTQA